MTWLYSPSFSQLALNNGILNGISPTATTCAISLYAGPKPTAANIIANWTSYNSAAANTLWVSTGFNFKLLNDNMVYAATIPAGVTPLHDGTATWGIIWALVAASGSPFSATTLTAAYQRFIVCDVTDTTGTGVIRLANTNMTVAGGAVAVSDVGIALAS